MQFKVNNITRIVDPVNGDSLSVQLADGKTINITIEVTLPVEDATNEEEILNRSGIRLTLLDRFEEDIRLMHNEGLFNS